ncbi:MAG: betaine-aldehyde dehydrogenase [Myxococcota bacterium]|nr:betaine-aldehyde dehydrogenase [Myxococcota bacterium]
MSLSDIKCFINGEWIETPSEGHFTTKNPATGQTLATVHGANSEIVQAAANAAKEAFPAWRDMAPRERARILHRASCLLREEVENLASLEMQDTGKPITEALEVDIPSAADCLEYFAGVAPTIAGNHIDLGGGTFGYTRREPLGVCGAIGAWNYPIQIAAWKAAPALACGNTVVYKPSEVTPITANHLARIFTEAGLPKGVFNVVHGHGDVGEAIVKSPDIAKISLTGEASTGKKVMAGAAQSLKKVTLELGGKSPLIVFEDADVKNAVSAAMVANFYTQGEICSNGTRVFVHEKLMDTFLEQLKVRTEKLVVGPPHLPETQIGSLIHQAHLEKVLSYIKIGQAEGATLVCGGNRVTKGPLGKGAFVQPTVFAQCIDSMRIATEEIFGPVMSVLSFNEEDDVVNRANNTPFGLAAGVFTSDIKRAHRVIAKLQAGTCWINNYNITPIELPFGGYKESGMGRENSLAAIDHYTQLKSVYVEMGNVDCPYE